MQIYLLFSEKIIPYWQVDLEVKGGDKEHFLFIFLIIKIINLHYRNFRIDNTKKKWSTIPPKIISINILVHFLIVFSLVYYR